MEGTRKLESNDGWLEEAPKSCIARPKVKVIKDFKLPTILANISSALDGATGSEDQSLW